MHSSSQLLQPGLYGSDPQPHEWGCRKCAKRGQSGFLAAFSATKGTTAGPTAASFTAGESPGGRITLGTGSRGGPSARTVAGIPRALRMNTIMAQSLVIMAFPLVGRGMATTEF